MISFFHFFFIISFPFVNKTPKHTHTDTYKVDRFLACDRYPIIHAQKLRPFRNSFQSPKKTEKIQQILTLSHQTHMPMGVWGGRGRENG